MTQRECDRLVALRKADKKLITQKQAAQQTGLSERHLRRLLRSFAAKATRPWSMPRGAARPTASSAPRRKNKPWQSSPNPSTPALARLWRRSISSSATASKSAAKRCAVGWPPRASGSPAAASQDARIRGGPAAVAAASWCNGTPPSTTGWRDAGRSCRLIGMIDDASSELLARFVRHDSGEENRRLLKTYLEQNGRPVAFYTDRASLFVNTPKNSAGEDPKLLPPTQIGRALQELDIESITAYSPQAKGRVERSFGTAQDRLVKGLRVAGATTIEQANAYLESEFLPWWNATPAGSPRRGASRARSRARSGLGAEPRRDAAGRQRLHDSLPGKELSNRPQGDCAGSAKQPSAGGETPGRRPGRALRQARTGAEALRRAAPIGAPAAQERPGGTRFGSGREGWRQSCRQAKQRLDEGLRSERQPACVASGAGIRRLARRYAGLGVAAKPRLYAERPSGRCAELAVAAKPRRYGERRANGAQRSSRWRSPRPPLRSFTKAISVNEQKTL